MLCIDLGERSGASWNSDRSDLEGGMRLSEGCTYLIFPVLLICFGSCCALSSLTKAATYPETQVFALDCPRLSEAYSHSICDDFEDGVINSSLWVPIAPGDSGVRVQERAGLLSFLGRTSRRDGQPGLDTSFSFPAEVGFEIALLVRATDDSGGGFVLEIHNTSGSGRYHITVMCGESQYGFWYCYFGDDAAKGCRQAASSPLRLTASPLPSYRELRVCYDGLMRQATATVDGRVIGRLAIPLPMGEVILRLFVQSPLSSSELRSPVEYAIKAVALGWSDQ